MTNKKSNLSFKDAVAATPDIASAYETGLSALGNHSKKIFVVNTSLIEGSVDLDKATVKFYPNDSRWDYAVSYDRKTYFIEVHTANTREVRAVISKLSWLKDWLNTKAPELNKLKAHNSFHWIQSSNFNIPKNTPQYRMAIAHKLIPVPILKLPA